MRSTTVAVLLSALLAASPIAASPHLAEDGLLSPGLVLPSQPRPEPEPVLPAEHTFTLRHIYHHGSAQYPELHRVRDYDSEPRLFLASDDARREKLSEFPSLVAMSRGESIERLVDRRPSVVDPLVAESRRQGFAPVMNADAWTLDEVPSPNITDKRTVLTMAFMASNAYVDVEGGSGWYDVGSQWKNKDDFGWETDGLRGHIFADENNSTVVIGIKGTSTAVWDGSGTTTNDKVNDNLFFSCCCGQQGQWTWRKVCDCATGTYSCNNTCVRQTLMDEHHYYKAARELYSNVTERYPNSTIWLTGHSLGGAVASLLGLTYGDTAVTFEAVPEALAASRLGLPVPPGADYERPQTRQFTGAYHFGHTADPVYIGTCNGATASCSFAGYAMESACHTGRECIYDVVSDKGWRVGIGTHRISSVIKDVIMKYDTVPECNFTPECRDCAQWKMFESNETETTTTSGQTSTTSTRTRTRTETCETPGWWGCLDTTTTGEPTLVPTTTSTSTSTCKTPGWFGCWDKTTTTTTTTEPTTTTTSTSTCKTPGWFGCKDKTTTIGISTISSSICKTPGHFWGCWDETTSTTTTTEDQDSSNPATTTWEHPDWPEATSTGICYTPGFFWGCWDKTSIMATADVSDGSAMTGHVPINAEPKQTGSPLVLDEI